MLKHPNAGNRIADKYDALYANLNRFNEKLDSIESKIDMIIEYIQDIEDSCQDIIEDEYQDTLADISRFFGSNSFKDTEEEECVPPEENKPIGLEEFLNNLKGSANSRKNERPGIDPANPKDQREINLIRGICDKDVEEYDKNDDTAFAKVIAYMANSDCDLSKMSHEEALKISLTRAINYTALASKFGIEDVIESYKRVGASGLDTLVKKYL